MFFLSAFEKAEYSSDWESAGSRSDFYTSYEEETETRGKLF